MKSVKQMLLGIAFLIVAAIGSPLWIAGSYVGAVMFFTGLTVGTLLCIRGYLSKNE